MIGFEMERAMYNPKTIDPMNAIRITINNVLVVFLANESLSERILLTILSSLSSSLSIISLYC